MIIDSPIISGSYAATGSLNQVGNVTITGSLTVTGPIIGALTGSVDSASFATTASYVSPNTQINTASFAITASYVSPNTQITSASFAITSSYAKTVDFNNTVVTSSYSLTASYVSPTIPIDTASFAITASYVSPNTQINSSSFATTASYASNADLLDGLDSSAFTSVSLFNTFSSSILSYTSSTDSRLGSLETASGSAIGRLNAIELTTGSLNTASGSAINRLNAIENKTGSYATTGSNTFDGGQYFSSSFNPTGFTTTASLYTDGGLRVTKDAYISGTLYLNNVTVFGTQSVAYISSSQLNIGTNIITVNTNTPSVRFGGLAVYDSGSTSLTGSILWDSQDNQWIYSNPSGSTYDSAMFLVGPRNSSALGNEAGINCNFLSKGNGMHHMTSSAIFEDGSRTCFYGTSFISSSGAVCFAGTVCAGTAVFGNTGAGSFSLAITNNDQSNTRIRLTNTGTGGGTFSLAAGKPGASNDGLAVYDENCSATRMYFNSAGNVGINNVSPAERLSVAGAIMSTCGITGHGANRTTISQEGLNGAFWQSYGTDTSTVGTFTLRQASSDFSVVRSPLVIASTGAATFSSTGVFGKANASAFKVLDVIADTTDGFNDPVNFESYGTAGANIILRFAKGTYAIPTAVSVNNLMGSIGIRGYDGTTFSGGGRAGIYMYAAEDFTPTAQGTFLDISTTPIGATTRVERIRVHNDGNVVIGSTCNSCFKLDVNGTGRFTSTLLVGETTITDGHLVNIIGNQSSVNIGVVLNNTNATHSRIYGITNVNGQFSIYDYTAAAQRFFISSTGISCFACQVCAPSFIGGTLSGTTIYGSTAVCSPVGKFTTCIDAGSATFSSSVTAKGTLTLGDAGVTNAIINSNDGMYFNIDADVSGGSPEFMFGKGRSGAGSGGTTFFAITCTGAATFSSTITGTTIYGSTAVCSPVGKFTSCIDAGSGTFSGNVAINGTFIGTDQTFGGAYRTFAFGTNSNGFNRIFAANDTSDGLYLNAATGQGINFRVNGGGANVFSMTSTGVATFSSTITGTTIYGSTAVCSPVGLFSGCVGVGTISPNAKLEVQPGSISSDACQEIIRLGVPGSSIFSSAMGYINFRGYDISNGVQRDVAWIGTELVPNLDASGRFGGNLVFRTTASGNSQTPQEKMRITSTGIACFACQVCVGGMVALNNTSFGGPATEAAFRIRMADNGGINNDPGIGLDGAGSGSERMWFNALSGHYFNNGTNGIKLNIDSAGIACFACQVCAPAFIGGTVSGTSATFSSNLQTNGVLTVGNQGVAGNYFLQITPSTTNRVALQGLLAGVGISDIVMQPSGGNVGIGTICPGKIFNVAANDTTSGNYQSRSAVIRIQNTNDVGANSRFAGVQFSFSPGASTGDNYVIGAVGAVLTDSSTQWSGDLVFAVKNATTATTLTEYARIFTGGVTCFTCQVCVGGSIIPLNNGSQDLGSSSLRWCTVYTSDLSLNNGIGNYTIVEGENDLFLYNNNSCKVFKFIVQEVCPEIAPAKRST